jgi:hypothetical protein
MAELAKTRARTSSYPRLPSRRVLLVKRPIPNLERGIGGNKVTVRIAICGISKAWRENLDESQKYAHLVNAKATAKPRIDDFLNQHPLIHEDQLNNELLGDKKAEAEGQADSDVDDEGDGDYDERNIALDGFTEARSGAYTFFKSFSCCYRSSCSLTSTPDGIPIDPQLQGDSAWSIEAGTNIQQGM